MDFLTDNLFLILLLLGGAFSQWLKSRHDAQQEQQNRPGEAPPERYEPEPTYQKKHAKPPSLPVQKKPNSAPLFDVEEELARQAELSEKIQQLQYEKRLQQSENKKSPSAELPQAPSALPQTSLRSTLRQRVELRKAIVLKEIFDKPLSLR